MPAHAAPFAPDPAAVAFLAKVSARLGGLDGFHPDTPFAEYVRVADDSRTFTEEEATALQAEFDALDVDIYAELFAYAETHLPGSFLAEHAARNRAEESSR